MESGNMSLKSVLTDLSQAIQTKAAVTGPLTLEEMTAAVNNISSSSSSKLEFYRCSEYIPAASVIFITDGLVTLPDGRKISLIGNYTKVSDFDWICAATVADNDYQSAEIIIEQMIGELDIGGYQNKLSINLESLPIAYFIASDASTENILFKGYNDIVIDREIVSSVNTKSFISCFSGYQITLTATDLWTESETLTTGLIPTGYIPIPGKIYSAKTRTMIASRYPELPEETIKFYRCQAVDSSTGTWSGYEMLNNFTDHIFEVSGADNADCNGIYTIFRYGYSRTDKVYTNGKYYLRTLYIFGDYSWAITSAPPGTYDYEKFYSTQSFSFDTTPLPSEATWDNEALQVSLLPYGWVRTDNLVENLPINGYTPQVGKIYSVNSTLKLEAAYPEKEQEALEFIECSYYQPAKAGEPLYPKILTLCDWSLAGENAESMASGIYYPANLSGEQATWSFVRSDSKYAVQVEKSAEGTTGRIVLSDASAEAVFAATGFIELEDIWDKWMNDYTCVLYTPDEAETGYEEGCMPYYFCNIVEWGNGNMFMIDNAGNSEVNGLYVRGSGCNDFFSAGCYDCWVNADGTAAIYHIEDWITDEEENNIFGLLIMSNGSSVYELPTADWNYNTTITSATQLAPYTWRTVSGGTPLPVLSDAEPERSEPSSASWSGYKVTQNSVTGAWSKSDKLTENLQVTYLTPKVGEIYSADTSIRVRKMYDGATIPIPSEGLVFYAPLAADYVDQISGKAAPVTGGTFTTHNGLNCLQLDGSDYIKWADNSDLPTGNEACSMVILAAPTNGSDWRTFMTVGDDSYLMDLAAKNGHFQEWGGERITADGKWQSLIITRADTSAGTAYLNGKLNGSGSTHVDNDLPAPSWVCAGAEPRVSYGYKVQGYIAFAAVYNRELSAEEAAEIHAVLMEDVEQ